MDEDIDGIPLEKVQNAAGFIPSKWETVDPKQIEAQAVTTSKWDTLDPVAPEPPTISHSQDSDSSNDDTFDSARDGDRFDEDKRQRLREIELKTIEYQDELECGQRDVKPGWTIQKQTEHFRRKLTKKLNKEAREAIASEKDSDRYISTASLTSSRKELSRRSASPSEVPVKKSKKSRRSRSPSPQYKRASPVRTSKSSRRSKSPHTKRTAARDSVSPPKRSKRVRSSSESSSESPKRYVREKSPSTVRTSRYESSPLPSKKYRSPSPTRTSRYELSPPSIKKYRSPSPIRSRYELSPQISKKYRSPSPTVVSSRLASRYATSPSRLVPASSSRRSPSRVSSSSRSIRLVEISSPVRYEKRSPTRHRSEKHKHKHKY